MLDGLGGIDDAISGRMERSSLSTSSGSQGCDVQVVDHICE